MSDAPAEAEHRRQQALLAALAAPRAAADAPAGLRVYRANAHASARRALATACPTLAALLGDEDFAALAREFWHAYPPVRGDLGEWGEALPGWIAAHAGLGEWPYLADCASLDLALHRCERAADAVPDTDSLGLLGSAEPSRLRLRLLPGVAVVTSAWPLASIHAAHASGADERAFDIARERIAQRHGEAVVVARDGWRAAVHPIEASALAFMQSVLGARDLARSLDAAGNGFDFAAWLAAALRLRWLQRIERVAA